MNDLLQADHYMQNACFCAAHSMYSQLHLNKSFSSQQTKCQAKQCTAAISPSDFESDAAGNLGCGLWQNIAHYKAAFATAIRLIEQHKVHTSSYVSL